MDLDRLLREAGTVHGPTSEALDRGRSALSAALVASTVGRKVRPKVPMRRLLGAIAIGVAATVALVVAPTVRFDGARPPASADAAPVLMRAAVSAGQEPGGWPNAAYWHAESEYQNWALDGGQLHHREVWVGRQSSSLLVDDGLFPYGAELTNDGTPGSFSAGAGAITWADLYALPTDPVALEQRLLSGAASARDNDRIDGNYLFETVADLLSESPASPSLRRALWEVAAGIPGVSLIGDATDSVGRSGVAVELGSTRLVVSPDDGQLLETIGLDSAGEVFYRQTYLAQGPSDGTPGTSILPGAFHAVLPAERPYLHETRA